MARRPSLNPQAIGWSFQPLGAAGSRGIGAGLLPVALLVALLAALVAAPAPAAAADPVPPAPAEAGASPGAPPPDAPPGQAAPSSAPPGTATPGPPGPPPGRPGAVLPADSGAAPPPRAGDPDLADLAAQPEAGPARAPIRIETPRLVVRADGVLEVAATIMNAGRQADDLVGIAIEGVEGELVGGEPGLAHDHPVLALPASGSLALGAGGTGARVAGVTPAPRLGATLLVTFLFAEAAPVDVIGVVTASALVDFDRLPIAEQVLLCHGGGTVPDPCTGWSEALTRVETPPPPPEPTPPPPGPPPPPPEPPGGWRAVWARIAAGAVTADLIADLEARAREDEAEALEALAYVHSRGLGVSIDYGRAYELYGRARLAGLARVVENMDEIWPYLNDAERARLARVFAPSN